MAMPASRMTAASEGVRMIGQHIASPVTRTFRHQARREESVQV
jgi:hypothetical protein